jgi:hypothetical protein
MIVPGGGLTRYDGLAGAVFLAVAAYVATSELANGPLCLWAWTFGIGGVCLLISAGPRAWTGDWGR